jgi:hypothetical protein
MRKVHYRVILDVFIHEDEGVDMTQRLSESGFCIDPYCNAVGEVGTIEDITIEDVLAIDSR